MSSGQRQRPQGRAKIAAGGSVTLRDVAREAGVSPMTVSNVVRGQYRSMSKETLARVEQAIVTLGYRPHSGARGLKLARRFSIGMLVVDESRRFLADPFITELVAGLTNYLSERGYDLVLQGIQADRLRNSTLVQNVETDGLCVLLSGSSGDRTHILEVLLALRQPIVLFQETSAVASADLCTIRQADREGGRMLAKLLLEGGDRDLVMMVPELEWPAIAERVAGVRDAIDGFGEGARLTVLRIEGVFPESLPALERHLERKGAPGAVLAGNDQIGFAVARCLAARGLTVPDDVRVTGFNAFEFWRYADLALTTVRSPAYEMGERGGAEILVRLEKGEFSERDVVLPVELRPGDTTRPRAERAEPK